MPHPHELTKSAVVSQGNGLTCYLLVATVAVLIVNPAPRLEAHERASHKDASGDTKAEASSATFPKAAARPRIRALAYSNTAYYRHPEIPAINRWLVLLGDRNGIDVDVTEHWRDLRPDRLDKYDVLILNNANELDKVIPVKERESVERWYKTGKGIVALHATLVHQTKWPWLVELGGCDFDSDSEFCRAKIIVDPAATEHPTVRGQANTFWYEADWTNHTRAVTSLPGFQVLLRVDEATYDPVRDYFKTRGGKPMGSDHPIAWTHEVDGGRFFYTEIGHDVRSLDTEFGRKHVSAAIQWAARRSDHDESTVAMSGIYERDNLVAWCIVPFDAKQRTPAERADMLKRLGIQRVAYDWRAKHIPEFEDEILQYKRCGLEYFAFWRWHESMEPLITKHGIRPQIWEMLSQPKGNSDAERVKSAAESVLPLVAKTRTMGLPLGLYNHGGWAGEPENLVAVCDYLRSNHAANHVGIVYNFHHGHDHVDHFEAAFSRMLPYLLCVNVNGMVPASQMTPDTKIVSLGRGQNEADMLKIVHACGYRGAIGILDHRPDMDAEESLRQNLIGLKRLVNSRPVD